jgi:methylenetetrahydrofolate reductase (NADPH)
MYTHNTTTHRDSQLQAYEVELGAKMCRHLLDNGYTHTTHKHTHCDSQLQAYGVELGAKMCRHLLDNGIPGLHMYSLNMEKSALAILERVGFIDNSKVCAGAC